METVKEVKPYIIGIAGGSGSGKSWLAVRLKELLGKAVGHLAVDDFYRNRSQLSPKQRERINFDHPRAIEWELMETVLKQWCSGRAAQVPRYNFAEHSRRKEAEWREPRPIILVEGLWVWRTRRLHPFYSLKLFIDCPPEVCLERRLQRDVSERGRSEASVRRQFWEVVMPMYERYVLPQARSADVMLRHPIDSEDVEVLTGQLRGLLEKREAGHEK